MMEFSNFDHQQQDLHGGSSSLPSPSFHLVGANHEWNHNLILAGGGFIPNVRDIEVSNDINPAPSSLSTHMIQDLGFCWSAPAEGYMNHPGHQATLDRIKEALSSGPYPKLSYESIRNPSAMTDFNLASTSCIKSEQQGLSELDERLLLRTTFPSGCQTSALESQGRDLLFDAPFGAACGRGSYSMVLPTTDISIANSSSSSSSSPMYPISLGMDLQALDLLASARYGRSFSGPFNSMALLRDDMPFGLGPMHDPAHEQASNSHYKISSLVSGVAEVKRANSEAGLEHKACQPVQKKSRFEMRSPCSPFKVRKEKLGDRIAALQQLVAPFGKTDTASVLMEAIGYIKFLQDQVETLSVPYMRSSNTKKLRTAQGASSEDGDEHRPDLRSRGLCLVPLSCTSYVTNENGGVWSPPNFRENN